MTETKGKTQGEETIATAMLLDIVNSRLEIPPMPANGPKLISLVQKPIEEIEVEAFVKIIDADPGLLAMILKLANSAYFKGVDAVYSLRSAIVRVGLQETINSANLYFFQRLLPEIPNIEGFPAQEYWTFSWACANAARRLGHPNLGMDVIAGELYISGLLHGIGKLIFAIQYPYEFSKCIQRANKFKMPLHVIEQEEFGATDTHVASKLLEFWELPPRICSSVEYYQSPKDAPKEQQNLAALVQFAYAVASMSGIGKNGDGCVTPIESTWIAKQPELLLSKKESQDAVVKEIHTTLEEKSESITGVALSKSKTQSTQQNSGSGQQAKENKSGFFAWIRSLFN